MLDSMHCEKTCVNLVSKNSGKKKSLESFVLSHMCEEEARAGGFLSLRPRSRLCRPTCS